MSPFRSMMMVNGDEDGRIFPINDEDAYFGDTNEW